MMQEVTEYISSIFEEDHWWMQYKKLWSSTTQESHFCLLVQSISESSSTNPLDVCADCKFLFQNILKKKHVKLLIFLNRGMVTSNLYIHSTVVLILVAA